jgi:hypothetical protein
MQAARRTLSSVAERPNKACSRPPYRCDLARSTVPNGGGGPERGPRAVGG